MSVDLCEQDANREGSEISVPPRVEGESLETLMNILAEGYYWRLLRRVDGQEFNDHMREQIIREIVANAVAVEVSLGKSVEKAKTEAEKAFRHVYNIQVITAIECFKAMKGSVEDEVLQKMIDEKMAHLIKCHSAIAEGLGIEFEERREFKVNKL